MKKTRIKVDKLMNKRYNGTNKNILEDFSMAFCTKCGAPMEDGAQFCTSCGHGAGQPVTASGASALRAFTAKNNVLILALLGGMALSLLFGFIVNVGGGVFSALVSAAISGILVYGVFLCWSQANKTDADPTAGFTIVKVFTILEIVAYALGGFVCLLFSLLFFSAQDLISDLMEDLLYESDEFYDLFEELVEAWDIGGWDEFCSMFGTIFFLLAAYCIVLIFLYCKPLLKHIASLKGAVTLDGPVVVPPVLPIMMFVIAGVGLISMFMVPGGVLGVFSSLISIATSVVGGLLLLNAKKELVH